MGNPPVGVNDLRLPQSFPIPVWSEWRLYPFIFTLSSREPARPEPIDRFGLDARQHRHDGRPRQNSDRARRFDERPQIAAVVRGVAVLGCVRPLGAPEIAALERL